MDARRRGFLLGALGLASLAGLASVRSRPGPGERGARVSVEPGDPAYSEWNAVYAEVRLDGRRLLNCVTADEELGEVRCLQLGPSDMWAGAAARPRVVTLRGRVEVRYLPGHPLYGRGYLPASQRVPPR